MSGDKTVSRPPAVSVIMNCFNSGRYLRQAIDSVYGQVYTDWEIVFWDNASTDDSARIARSYDGKLRYFRSELTVPLGQARNWAIRQARGEYIAFLDCDDIWLPEKLGSQVRALSGDSAAALAYSNYYRLYPDGRKRLNFVRKQPDGYVFDAFLYAYPVGLLTAMVRRSSLDALDTLFDPQLYLWEQYDLFMRILSNSRAVYQHQAFGIYRVHPESGTVKRLFTHEYVDELSRIIDNFRKRDPAFMNAHKKGFSRLVAKMTFMRAKIEIAQGNLPKGRALLEKTTWFDYKFLILYMLTFLPRQFVPLFLKMREKYILGF